jgi:hypothetical protein
MIATKVSEMLNSSFENEIFDDDNYSFTLETSIQILMFCISCFNLWNLSITYKTYTLLHHPTSGMHDLDETFKINSPNASIILTDVQNDMEKKVKKSSWLSNQQWEKEIKLGERWQIKVWAPTEIHLTLLSRFSPLHVLFLFNMNHDNFWQSFVFIVFNYYIMQLLNHLWTGRIRDQSIVSGQVLKEFTNGFVYKLPAFKSKKESYVQSSTT